MRFAVALAALLLVGVFVSAGWADGGSSTPGPTVATDKTAYVPGDTVHVTGTGWVPNESVHVHAAANAHSFAYDTDVIASVDGNVAASFVLPSDYADTFAVALSSALGGTMSASFSDAFAASSNPQPPAIVSDQADYAPGSPVTLTGANWQPLELVHISVNDDNGQTWSYATDVTSSANGSFSVSFNLPTTFIATYSVTAAGPISGTATTTFTDGNVKFDVAPMGSTAQFVETLYSASGTCSGAIRSGFPKTLTNAGGDTVGVGNNESLRIDAAATSDQGGAFQGWSTTDGSPFTVIAGTGSKSICIAGFQSGTRNYRATYDVPVNHTPVATSQSTSTNEDTPKVITLQGTDADSNTLSFSIVSGPGHGSLGAIGSVTCGSGTCSAAVTYTPAPNYNGSDSFTFKVNDGTVDSPSALVSIAVNPVNDAPTCTTPQSDTTSEDTPKSITMVCTDVDGDPLTYSIVSGPSHGSLSSGTSGTRTYTPDANYNGSDSFTFKANDGSADSNVATFDLTITAANDAPSCATPQSDTTAEDTSKSITMVCTDPDVDGLTYNIVSGPSHGSLSSGTSGTRTYTPDANYNGSDSFTFKANDGSADSNVATFDLAVTEVNDTPAAADDSPTVAEDGSVVVDLKADDSPGPANESGQALTVTAVGSPAHGTAALITTGPDSGKVLYTPDADYNGSDTFTYTVTDNGTTNGANDSKSDSASADVTVTEVNDKPVAANDSKSTAEDNALTFAASDLVANDSAGPANEGSQTLTVTAVGSATHGTATLSSGQVTFTPDVDYNGSATFTYTVTDNGTTNGANDAKSDTATVNVTVTEVNDKPTAVNDSASVAEDSGAGVLVDVKANDSKGPANESGQTLTISAVGAPSHGTATLEAGQIRYTPTEADYNGPDSFTYTVTDDGTTNGVADHKSDTATVTITVTEVNDAPTAVNDSASVAEDSSVVVNVKSNDSPGPSNESGQALTVTALSIPAHGTASVISSGPDAGKVTYTPDADFNGPDSFTYTITDNGTTNGAADPKTDTATVDVTVTEVNDKPTAVNDSASVAEDSATGVLIDAAANDNPGPANESGQTLTITAVGTPSHGTAAIESGKIRYTPTEANYNGPDSFTYTITDNGKTNGVNDFKSDTATVNVTVTPVNDAPAVNAGPNKSANEDGTVSISSTFTDVDSGDAHTCQINWGEGTPVAGTVTEPTGSTPGTCSGSHQYLDDNPTATVSDDYTVTVTVTDNGKTNGVSDPKSGSGTLKATISNLAPVITAMVGPAGPQAIGSTSTVTTSFTDVGTKDAHTCMYSWDDGKPNTTVTQSGTGTGVCSTTHSYTAAGVYQVHVKVVDDDTGMAEADFVSFIVIYDPANGFVTGGGTINSPAGAYRGDLTLTGKANFGFNSKYQKGANVPDGQTEFQFQAGNFNFHSTAYQWLVVSGAKAQFKGTGTVNNVDGYGFLLTATDGDVNGGGGVDKFRMKVWKLSDGSIVYDNVYGASDDIDAASPQTIATGSIVIHK
jgi:large repetitive protein